MTQRRATAEKKAAKDHATQEDVAGTATVIAHLKEKEATPASGAAHNDLGVLHYRMGNKEKALFHYEEAVRIEPYNATARKNLADFYFVEQGRTEEALRLYNQLLAEYPGDQEILLILGKICCSLGLLDDARFFFQQVIEKNPCDTEARASLEELDRGKKTISRDAASPLPYPQILELAEAGDTEEAITELRLYLQMNPGAAFSHNDLATLSFRVSDKVRALYHFEKAVKLEPENTTYMKNLADFYFFELEEVDDSIRLYLAALDKNPTDTDTLFNLGLISVAVNRPEEARSFFTRITQLEPMHEGAHSQLQSLQAC